MDENCGSELLNIVKQYPEYLHYLVSDTDETSEDFYIDHEGWNSHQNTDIPGEPVTINICTSPIHDATTPSGQGPPHYRGFVITLTTLGRTPVDE